MLVLQAGAFEAPRANKKQRELLLSPGQIFANSGPYHTRALRQEVRSQSFAKFPKLCLVSKSLQSVLFIKYHLRRVDDSPAGAHHCLVSSQYR